MKNQFIVIMKSNLKYLTLISFGLITMFNINAQTRMKIGYKQEFTAEFIDIPSGKSFKENIILKRVPGFANGLQKRISWEYRANLNLDSTVYKKLDKLVGDTIYTKDGLPITMTNFNIAGAKTITGLIENKKVFWIHPPRFKYFKIFEFGAFPYENKKEDIYSDSITTKKGWGKFEGITILSDYKIVSRDENEVIVTAVSTSVLGVVDSKCIFNKNGIYYMEYNFFNEIKIIIKPSK